MTDTTQAKRPAFRPVYHPCLGRSVPTTNIGTVRFFGGPLVFPELLSEIEVASRAHRLTSGQIVQQLWDHAKANGFQFRHDPEAHKLSAGRPNNTFKPRTKNHE